MNVMFECVHDHKYTNSTNERYNNNPLEIS